MPSNAEMAVASDGGLKRYVLRFPRVAIEWTLPIAIPPMPVAINWGKLGAERDIITLTPIIFVRGRFSLIIPAAYEFDGASIPRLIRWAPGYERIGRHLWAALAHDWLCDHPEILPRVIADAIFVTLLLDTGVGRRQSRWMFRAVRLWSLYRAWKGGEDGGLVADTAKVAACDPVGKAEATNRAFDKAMLESKLNNE